MNIARVRNTRTDAVVISILGHYVTFNNLKIAMSAYGRRVIADIAGIDSDTIEFRML